MMKKLEREFLINTLLNLETILSIEDELTFAVRHIAIGSENSPRYQTNSRITNAHQWLETDKVKFTAAISEAIVRATKSLYTEEDESVKVLEEAKTKFLDEYVPRLTANTSWRDRLGSVRKNGEEIRKELIADLKSEVPYTSSFDNGFTLFSFVAASAAVVASSIAFAMRK